MWSHQAWRTHGEEEHLPVWQERALGSWVPSTPLKKKKKKRGQVLPPLIPSPTTAGEASMGWGDPSPSAGEKCVHTQKHSDNSSSIHCWGSVWFPLRCLFARSFSSMYKLSIDEEQLLGNVRKICCPSGNQQSELASARAPHTPGHLDIIFL